MRAQFQDATPVTETSIIFDANKLQQFILASGKNPKNDRVRHISNSVIKWESVPDFAVITGANGSGKSYFLEKIKEHLSNEVDPAKLIPFTYLSAMYDEQGSSSAIKAFPKMEEVFDMLQQIGSLQIDEAYIKGNTLNIARIISMIPIQNTSTNTMNAVKNFAEHNWDNPITLVNDIQDRSRHGAIKEAINKYIAEDLDGMKSREISVKIASTITEAEKKYLEQKEYAKQQLTPTKELYREWKMRNPNASMEEMDNFLLDEQKQKAFIQQVVQERFPDRNSYEIMNGSILPANFSYSLGLVNNKLVCISKSTIEQNVGIETLSDGERTVLKIASMVFYNQGCGPLDGGSKNLAVHKPRIILMDEPDRHLDPRSCTVLFDFLYNTLVKKLNMQVIMTTHRPDTVKLAPSDSIFVAKKTIDANSITNILITPVHQQLALFKLSGNLHFLPTKVYVESHTDCQVMSHVLMILRNMSDKLRAKFHMHSERNYQFTGLENIPGARLISRRYQFFFQSAATDKKGGNGGKKAVQNFVSSEKETPIFHESTDSRQITLPIGLIDRDYDSDSDFKNSSILQLKRHSIENYLFDPFVLLNVINKLGAKVPAQQNELHNSLIALSGSMSQEVSAIQQSVTQYFQIFLKQWKNHESSKSFQNDSHKILARFKKVIFEKFREGIIWCSYSFHNQMYQIKRLILKNNELFNKNDWVMNESLVKKRVEAVLCDKTNSFLSEKQRKQSEYQSCVNNMVNEVVALVLKMLLYEMIQGFNLDSPPTKTIPIINTNTGTTFGIVYPTLFLFLRGHDGESLIGSNIIKEAAKELHSCTYIPGDLAETIFTINQFVRERGKEYLCSSSRMN